MGPIGLTPESATSGLVVDASAPPTGSTTRSVVCVQAAIESTPADTTSADAVSNLESALSILRIEQRLCQVRAARPTQQRSCAHSPRKAHHGTLRDGALVAFQRFSRGTCLAPLQACTLPSSAPG